MLVLGMICNVFLLNALKHAVMVYLGQYSLPILQLLSQSQSYIWCTLLTFHWGSSHLQVGACMLLYYTPCLFLLHNPLLSKFSDIFAFLINILFLSFGVQSCAHENTKYLQLHHFAKAKKDTKDQTKNKIMLCLATNFDHLHTWIRWLSPATTQIFEESFASAPLSCSIFC